MLLESITKELAEGADLSRITITSPQASAVLATPTLAYAGFAAGWLAGDIIKNIIKGG